MNEIVCKSCKGTWYSNTQDDYCDPCVIAGLVIEREDKEMSKWSVWVGGGEINDYHLTTLAEAEELAQIWKDKGYDEVAIEEIK